MLSLGTNCNCISRLVASSMNTSSVQRSPRSSNQRVVAAVDLPQFAVRLAPQPRLVEAPALLARQPHAGLDHPGPQRLTAYLDAVLILEHLDRERRTEVGVPGPDQLQRVLPNAGGHLVVRRLASAL